MPPNTPGSATDDGFDDNYLVRRTQEGYLDAFEQLVERHSTGVFHLAYRLVLDRHAAQDIAQESFLQVYRNLPRFRQQASFKTWLYRIVTNQSLSALRRTPASRSWQPPSEDHSSPNPGPADAAVRDALGEAVHAAIADLPPGQRAALVLSWYEDLSYAQIAEITATSEPAVRSALFRARRSLASALGAWR